MLTLTSVVLLLLPVYLIYNYIIYPICLSPLRFVPSAHPTAPFSPLWILYKRYTSHENKTIHDAHLKHGAVVRLGPNEVAINTVAHGVKTIYSGNFEKHHWYDQMVNFGNVPNMFATLENKPHAARKRMMSNVYSKTYLQNSKGMEAISRSLIYGRLLPKLNGMMLSASGGNEMIEVDIMPIMNATTMDFVTAWLFGLKNSSKLLLDDEKLRWWLDVFLRRIPYGFLGAELPVLEGWLNWAGVRLAPAHVAVANKEIGEWVMNMCDKADADLAKIEEEGREIEPIDVPMVWGQLRTRSAKVRHASTQAVFDDKILAASDMWDHLTAGFETSGITLSYVFYELTRNPKLQSALRAELLTLDPPVTFKNDSTIQSQELPSPRSIDALPLLNAVLLETLRLHSAIPGPQPRISPAQGCVLGGASVEAGGYYIPAGTRVSSQAYSLHRDPEVFEDPETWIPSRWLTGPENAVSPDVENDSLPIAQQEERLKLMHRAFWAFSSGSRMCIGNNFATQEMKLVIAAVCSNFELLEVGDGRSDEAMVQEDAYTAQPVGRDLRVGLRPVKN